MNRMRPLSLLLSSAALSAALAGCGRDDAAAPASPASTGVARPEAVAQAPTNAAKDHPALRVIVLDDGSTDGTGDLVRDLIADEPRFEVIHGGREHPPEPVLPARHPDGDVQPPRRPVEGEVVHERQPGEHRERHHPGTREPGGGHRHPLGGNSCCRFRPSFR